MENEIIQQIDIPTATPESTLLHVDDVFFSEEYVQLLLAYSKIIKKMKDNNHVLLFTPKTAPEYVMISKMSHKVLINITADKTNVSLPTSLEGEMGFSKFNEFLDLVKSTKYPKGVNSFIRYVRTDNSYGQKLHHLTIGNKSGKFHIALGRPSLFTADDDKIVPNTPDRDPTELYADISLSKGDLKELIENSKLMGKPEIFGLEVDNGICTIFIKDPSGERQYTKVIDENKTKCTPGKTTKPITPTPETNSIRLFTTLFFDNLNELSNDYRVLLRYSPQADTFVLKAYGLIPTPNGSPIGVIVLTVESRKHKNIIDYEVIR